jgi:hypothetical protein
MNYTSEQNVTLALDILDSTFPSPPKTSNGRSESSPITGTRHAMPPRKPSAAIHDQRWDRKTKETAPAIEVAQVLIPC